MKQFVTLFFALVAVLSALPENAKAQNAMFQKSGVMQNCSTSPAQFKICKDGEGGANLGSMLSPLVGSVYTSMMAMHIDENLEIDSAKWIHPQGFSVNPIDIYKFGDKIMVLMRAISSSDNDYVATMILDAATLNPIEVSYFTQIIDAIPHRIITSSKVLVNRDGQAELWDISSLDPDRIPLEGEAVFSQNFLDGSGFAYLSYQGIYTVDLDGIVQSQKELPGPYTPWGTGVTSNSTVEAYTQSSESKRFVLDYVDNELCEYVWEENHISFAYGEVRGGLVAGEAPGTSLIGNHTTIWCGENSFDLKDYIPEIADRNWVVSIDDTDYDPEFGVVWITGNAREYGGQERFYWFGKVPVSEVGLPGMPELTSIMRPEKHDFSVYPNPSDGRVVVKGLRGQIEVRSSVGQKVQTLNLVNENGQSFDLSDLPKGAYYFHCPGQNGKGGKIQAQQLVFL